MSQIKEFTYSNSKYSFSITNGAAAVTKLVVPDKNGNPVNIALPVKDLDNIFSSDGCLGYIVGRVANRIHNSKFTLNGKTYLFEPNDGPNLLHGGNGGLMYKLWDVRKESDGFTCSCKLLSSEDHFPGDLEIWVRYSLTESGVFSIRYKAVCSEDTPLNLTNHAYFNLSGNFDKKILDHKVQLESSKYLEVDSQLIPTGRIINVQDTDFDFRKERRIDSAFPEGGFDHCFIIDREDGQLRGFKQFATVKCEETGIVLKAYTDLPSFQFYTGNHLTLEKSKYDIQTGFCLETQYNPDSVNIPSFPSTILKAGTLFESTTSYAFSVEK